MWNSLQLSNGSCYSVNSDAVNKLIASRLLLSGGKNLQTELLKEEI